MCSISPAKQKYNTLKNDFKHLQMAYNDLLERHRIYERDIHHLLHNTRIEANTNTTDTKIKNKRVNTTNSDSAFSSDFISKGGTNHISSSTGSFSQERDAHKISLVNFNSEASENSESRKSVPVPTNNINYLFEKNISMNVTSNDSDQRNNLEIPTACSTPRGQKIDYSKMEKLVGLLEKMNDRETKRSAIPQNRDKKSKKVHFL